MYCVRLTFTIPYWMISLALFNMSSLNLNCLGLSENSLLVIAAIIPKEKWFQANVATGRMRFWTLHSLLTFDYQRGLKCCQCLYFYNKKICLLLIASIYSIDTGAHYSVVEDVTCYICLELKLNLDYVCSSLETFLQDCLEMTGTPTAKSLVNLVKYFPRYW